MRRTPSNSFASTWIYDGDDVFMKLPGSYEPVEYTYYPGIDQPHSLKRGSSIHYYATDYPGNVVGLIGSQHELANEYRYTPFGEREYAREDVGNALQFRGSKDEASLARPVDIQPLRHNIYCTSGANAHSSCGVLTVMLPIDPKPSGPASKAHTPGTDHHLSRGRMRLLRLAVSCPRCGARPAVRVRPALVEMLSREPAGLHLATYQCHRQKCGHVYDITAGAYQRAS